MPCCALRVLRLTLKRKWFDMIASGEKREEYRTPGKWILSRLEGKEYDRIEFKNGYGQNVPTMEVEYLGWAYSFGKRQWGGGGEQGKPFATIYLGRLLSLHQIVLPQLCYENRNRKTQGSNGRRKGRTGRAKTGRQHLR
jgi:hypothetical protein